MTNKLKCPFCQQELHKDPDGYYSCYTDNCSVMNAGGNGASGTESLWTALAQAKQDLDFFKEEQDRSATALIERTKELDKCQKDLEQSEKCCSAWEAQALDYQMKTIALSGDLEIAKSALRQIESRLVISPEIVARQALEQIEHKE